MVKRWTLVYVFFACLSHSVWGADATPGTRETALELLKSMGNEKALDVMFDARIQSDPKLAPYRATLLTFFEKYMNWDVAASKLADLYARTFTESELREMIAFYKSSVGEKLLAQSPVLLEEERKIVEQTFAEHKAQLEEMIRAQTKEVAPHARKPEGESRSVKPGPRGQAPEEIPLDRANRLFDAKNWTEARDAYVEYLKSEPENVNAMTDLGTCYRELGDFEGALREYDRALALDPEHWQTLYNKIILLGFDLKRNAEAQVLLRRLRALQPYNSDVEKLATVLARQ